MKHVLIISNFFPPLFAGGAEVVVYNSCKGLRERGVDATIMMTNARFNDAVDRFYDYQGVPVHEVRFASRLHSKSMFQVFEPRIYHAVRREIERVRPDLVHMHNLSGASLAPVLACRDAGVPAVLTLHDHWLLCPNNNLYQTGGGLCNPASHGRRCSDCFTRYDFWADVPLRKRLFQLLTRSVGRFYSPSQRLVDLHAAAGYDPRRFRVVPNGIPHRPAEGEARSFIKQAVAESLGANTLLLAGAIAETKGIQVFLRALPLLQRYIPNLHVWVAGEGEPGLSAALRRHTPGPVRMFGKLPFNEMRPLYACADLTVVPSIWEENSPMVIYESALAGTPILGSKIGGIPELVREGVTGYLFPRMDEAALAERAIQHFARPPVERRQMRQRCAEYAQAHFTVDCHLDALQAAYIEDLSRSINEV
jgi:glycosyltransferase involved in cell wall biosynthesis